MEKYKDSRFLGIKRKTINILGVILLIIFVLSEIFYKGTIESYWPYFLMIIGMVIYANLKDKKLAIPFFIGFLASLFIMQAIFYFILPLSNNYQPVPTLPKMQIFDLAGKFQISYYPDIPEAGDNMQLYLDLCDVGLINCVKCEFCYITGYFINEKGENKILFQNRSTNISEPIQFSYPGRRVNIELDFEGIDSRYKYFHIPKLNFYQAIIYFTKKSPIFSIISLASSIVFIITVIIFISNLSKKIIKKRIFWSKKKIKSKIEEILKH